MSSIKNLIRSLEGRTITDLTKRYKLIATKPGEALISYNVDIDDGLLQVSRYKAMGYKACLEYRNEVHDKLMN